MVLYCCDLNLNHFFEDYRVLNPNRRRFNWFKIRDLIVIKFHLKLMEILKLSSIFKEKILKYKKFLKLTI